MRNGTKAAYKKNQSRLAYLLLAPSLLLLAILIGYPMVYNIIISFRDVPINPRMEYKFVGLANYIDVLTDIQFYRSLLTTFLFIVSVVSSSTAAALFLSVYLNRPFLFKKLVHSIIIMSYVIPSVCLIFIWRYMFNSIYGIVNYVVVDVLRLSSTVPLWFDNRNSAFLIVAFFALWKFYPYAFMSFNAILQSIDKTLYEAAEVDGANIRQRFMAITFPAVRPAMITVITLRTIWVFYIYTEVYLLSRQVDVIGVYLYEMAFSTYELGKAAAFSIVLFSIIMSFVLFTRKRATINE